MKQTSIQWCDSTVNPVAGCHGCELFPTSLQLKIVIASTLKELGESASDTQISNVLNGLSPSEIYHKRKQIAKELSHEDQ